MSFLGGNSSRPDFRPQPDSERPGRSEGSLLADADQRFGSTADSTSRGSFTSEARPSNLSGPTPPDRCENILASGAKFKGTLTVETSVRVDGNFTGEIQSKATVHVASGALVDAKIRAAYVVIAGTFHGEIRCEQRVDLQPSSRVNGEIITKVFTVQEGAIFDGHIQMTEGETQRLSSRSARTATDAEPAAAAARQAPNGNAAP